MWVYISRRNILYFHEFCVKQKTDYLREKYISSVLKFMKN